MKLTDLIKTSNNNLFRNKGRTILTILAIFVGSFAINTTTAIQTGVNSFIDSQTESFGGEGFIQAYGKTETDTAQTLQDMQIGRPTKYNDGNTNSMGQPAITEEQIEKFSNIEGIIKDTVLVGRFATVTYVQSTKNDERFTAQLNQMTTKTVHYDMVAGENIENNTDEYQVLLPNNLWTESLGYEKPEDAVGQKLNFVWSDPITNELKTYAATIVGVQAPSVINSSAILINTPLNSVLYEENVKYLPAGEKGKVFTVAAEYDYQNYSADDIKQKISEIGLEGMTVKDIMGQIKGFFDAITNIFTAFGYIALIAAAIGIINTLLMSVQERTREIGLMKTFGMSKFKIFLSFALEATLLGFWGAVSGLLVSFMLCSGIDNFAHTKEGFLTAFPTMHLAEYNPGVFIPVILVIMVIAFIAGVFPAIKASKKNPIDSLRYE